MTTVRRILETLSLRQSVWRQTISSRGDLFATDIEQSFVCVSDNSFLVTWPLGLPSLLLKGIEARS